MASPPPAGAKTSRWGSFLTGLESRLDTILADEDVVSKTRTDGGTSEPAENKGALTVPTAQKARADSMDYTS